MTSSSALYLYLISHAPDAAKHTFIRSLHKVASHQFRIPCCTCYFDQKSEPRWRNSGGRMRTRTHVCSLLGVLLHHAISMKGKDILSPTSPLPNSVLFVLSHKKETCHVNWKSQQRRKLLVVVRTVVRKPWPTLLRQELPETLNLGIMTIIILMLVTSICY